MPDLPVKEVRLSELHLPELKRDDIVKSLSERLPDVDLSKIERPTMPDVDLPKLDLPSMDDIGKAVAGAAAAAGFGRRARPRWPFAVGALIVAGLASWAILSNEAVRARISGGAHALRDRIAAAREGMGRESDTGLDIDRDDPVAFDAADTAPIQPGPYADDLPGAMADSAPYPDGLGNGNRTDEIPAFEESGRPA